MRGNELVGLSASCDPPAQKVLAVTHTMISRFLEQARTGNYIGFPADGTQVTELTDPFSANSWACLKLAAAFTW